MGNDRDSVLSWVSVRRIPIMMGGVNAGDSFVDVVCIGCRCVCCLWDCGWSRSTV